MTDVDWKSTACVLCYVNCGIEVATEGRTITKVRGDKAHPGTRGYLCQKAQRLPFYGRAQDRLTSPLKRRADGGFDEIDWDTAIGEIAARLGEVREFHGGESLAFYGGGGQGNHLGGPYGIGFVRALGCTSLYSSLAQEKTGDFWLNGHLFGSQICHTAEGIEDADLVIFLGANPWMAHGFRNARKELRTLSKDPDRHVIVIDPVRTETVDHADLHLQLAPGTDSYLLGAILALLKQRGALDRNFLAEHTTGADKILRCLDRIPIDDWIAHTGVPRADIDRAVALIAGAKAMSVRAELGVQQGRHSTLYSYFEKLLFLLTGNFGRAGTNGLHSWLQPLWGTSRGGRSAVTGMAEIAGLYPPNRFTAEVLGDSPNRLRALFVDSSNPANTVANSDVFEKAIAALDLVVVVDIAMTETAALADYVLPAASQYEKWEYTLFSFSFPENDIQLRAPLFAPLPGTLPEPEIYTRLAREMGLLPDAETLSDLRATAANDREIFAGAFRALLKTRREFAALAPEILYLTLGATLPGGAGGAAVLWPGCHRVAKEHPDAVRRGLASDAEGAALGDTLFDRIVSSRSGTVFAHHDTDDVWKMIRHQDGRIHLVVSEMLDWIDRLDPAAEQLDADYPLILMAGQRRSYNANQIIRRPGWRKSDIDGSLRIHPDDLAAINAVDGDWVSVETRTGRLTVRAEANDRMRPGMIALPHGYGMKIKDANGAMVTAGPRINRLTASDECDPIAATPYHKTIPAAVTWATNEEISESEAASERVHALVRAAAE